MRARLFLTSAIVLAAIAACGGGSFDSASQITSVRILASSADKPYAKPGDNVTVQVLAYDGRPNASSLEPMTISWLPIVCTDPASDLYYGCFAPSAYANVDGGASSADAGTPSGGIGGLPTGVDLTPLLPSGASYSFEVPANAITAHMPVEGAAQTAGDPYGLVILFNIACAGHLELVPIAAGAGPQSVPIACFDSAHNLVGPDGYVIGFTRVYVYADRTNTNPAIDHVMFNGAAVDPTAGITVTSCPTLNCNEPSIDTVVPASSQEPDPGDVGPDGSERNEQVWVEYFATAGKFDADVRLLYDPVQGQISGSATHFQVPSQPGDGVLWAIVHDNRGGATWMQIPMHVQ